MANTSISDIAARIVKNPASAIVNSRSLLTTDSYPGQFVVKSSGKWVLGDASTAAHKLKKAGVLDYAVREYTDSSDAIKRPTIDEVIDVSEEGYDCDVCTSGIVAGFCTDQGAAVEAGTYFMLSTTAGSATSLAQDTNSGSLSSVPVAILLRDIADDDTVGIFGIGKFMNERGAY